MHPDQAKYNCGSFSSTRGACERSGAVLVVVIVLLTLSLLLFGIWAKSAIQLKRQLGNEQVKLQSARLAESGLRRAIARLVTDANYRGEIWSIPAGVVDSSHAAEVRISLAPIETTSSIRVVATADYPLNTPFRARVTKQIEVPSGLPGDES